MSSTRSPICATLGHVDHGKSSILDSIRGTSIVSTEAGKITQAIGASIVPMETIRKQCGAMLDSLNLDFTIPGLLFIDTPGHAAFSGMRQRGGNLADIAILVVDINEGFKPQTIEALEILKKSKTPFVVAANKVDIVPGFVQHEGNLLEMIKKQSDPLVLDNKVYELVGKLSEFGINSERFDRVEDFTKQIAIVPTSATKKIGIPELLMVIAGLAQRFLESCLQCQLEGPAKGIVLEVKEEKGLGTTIDVILNDGTLNVNDTIVVGGLDKPIVTKVKALLEPAPMAEIRDKKTKFKSVKSVRAAMGIKIAAPGFDEVVAGMPLRSVRNNLEEVKKEIQEKVDAVLVETDNEGIVIKADNIGSLEALRMMLSGKDIPVKKASIGDISKKDIFDAQANMEKEKLYAAILGFNVKLTVQPENIKVITEPVIYTLVDKYETWKEEMSKKWEEEKLEKVTRPFKLRIMPGYIFRQCNPAVVGVEVMEGTLRSNVPVMNTEGRQISRVKGIQLDQDKIEKAETGKQVAVSLDDVTVGRQIKEGDTLFSEISEEEFRQLKEQKKFLTDTEKIILKEIAGIKRNNNPVWGV